MNLCSLLVASLLFAINIESLLIRLESPTVSRAILFDNIADVSEKFNLELIRLLSDTVSLPKRLLNIAEVSVIFNLVLIL